MLERVRMELGRTERTFDPLYLAQIEEAKAALSRHGVVIGAEDEPKPLIRSAIVAYVKAANDFEGKGDKYMEAFNSLACELSGSTGYTSWEVGGNA